MLRRSLVYLLLLACGLLGWWGWEKNRPASAPEVKSALARRPAAVPRSTAAPIRLEFLTDLGQPYQARILSLRSTLEAECSEPELRYLYQLLENGPPAAEVPEHGYMVANEVMGQLMKHEKDRSRFASQFMNLLKDPRQPAVVRDYTVQFLGSLIDPRKTDISRNPKAISLSPEITEQVMKSLVSAATDPALSQTSVPGTSLMIFSDLACSGGGLDCRPSIAALKPWIGQALTEGSTFSLACRVSAVVAAGILAPEDFGPALRKIAYQPDGGGALQLPAIASLGQSGDAADLPKLQHIAATHPTLAYAASDACRVLTARLTGEPPAISQ